MRSVRRPLLVSKPLPNEREKEGRNQPAVVVEGWIETKLIERFCRSSSDCSSERTNEQTHEEANGRAANQAEAVPAERFEAFRGHLLQGIAATDSDWLARA